MNCFWLPFAIWKRRSWLVAGLLLLLLLLLRHLAMHERLKSNPREKLFHLHQKTAFPHSFAKAWGSGKAGLEKQGGPNIVFLKTHKTGSSTVQNILFRAGEQRNLTVAFPRYSYQFAYPEHFSRDFVEDLPPRAARFNLLCSHMRLDAGEARAVVPPPAVFLTILRDPARTFESVFHYYRNIVPAFQPLSNHSKPLLAFLEAPHRYYNAQDVSNGLARNPMTFDLGLNTSQEAAPSDRWASELERLNRTFQLVMIAEHFDESLLLARELLGLGMDELMYVRLNVRHKEEEPMARELVQKIQAWNWVDVQLYRFFQSVFWRKVERYGYVRMKRELAAFRALLRKAAGKCLAGEPVGPEVMADELRPWQPGSVTILGYNLRQNLTSDQYRDCFRMVLPELQYHAYLYYRQYGRDMRPLPTA
uniref:galactosylceramide sulfotransferase-like n=1 Tax=Euleptes europaea TaxID=460621 RepID=UPI002542456C|nr:galactosylceramide sulfotransferase-like [Euleptes europaea]